MRIFSRSAPAVVGGTLFIASSTGRVLAYDASDGAEVWVRDTGYVYLWGPTVADGIAYVAAEDGTCSRSTRWTAPCVWDRAFAGPILNSPAVAGGLVYVGSTDKRLLAWTRRPERRRGR
jgi:serine/threonine-protein kinase